MYENNENNEMESTIELTNEISFGSKLKRKIKFFVGRLIITGLVGYALLNLGVTTQVYLEDKYHQVKLAVTEQFKVVEYKTKLVTPKNVDINNLVIHYSKANGIHPIVGLSIVEQESGFSQLHLIDRIRFEPSWKAQYSKKWKRDSWMTDAEYDMYFHSIGLMQIGYGLHKDFCGINSWSDLIDPERNVACGLSIISKCLYDNRNIASKRGRLRRCLVAYNGSGPMAEQYADEVMARMQDYLLDGVDIVDDTLYSTPIPRVEKNEKSQLVVKKPRVVETNVLTNAPLHEKEVRVENLALAEKEKSQKGFWSFLEF